MSRWHYFLHLVLWAVPLIVLQWIPGWRVLRRHWRAVVVPALGGVFFFSCCDAFAVRAGLWFFDPKQILGWHLGPLPVEEVLFFFLTSWLVAQSLVLMLPARLRGEAAND
ncbi:MAG: lycopene cyclase domain-containing protein [Verrucomicrobia bacterium]|nr:lycopene cyclase domain-containing protein [Verrucomicrobiota bacterium]MBV9658674.1 lycopene cyclase domain-containing protein [Verrucomicrobiota bacterium]